jgi:hypothetical protein
MFVNIKGAKEESRGKTFNITRDQFISHVSKKGNGMFVYLNNTSRMEQPNNNLNLMYDC